MRQVGAELLCCALVIFFSRTRLFSSRVSWISTANSPTVLAMQVPADQLMLWSSLGRWLSSRWWQCWRRIALGKGAEGLGTTSVE